MDEAHGAHFGISEYFPRSAIQQGADIVVQSIHKTLAGMTQTAVLHIGRACEAGNELFDKEKLEFFLRLYQSSSPSYVLMTSVDKCFMELEVKKDELFSAYYKRLSDFYKKCKSFLHVNILPENVDSERIFARDCGKIIIYAKGMNGGQICDYLKSEHMLQLEMSCGNYALAMTSYMDTDEGFCRLYEALMAMDKLLDEEMDKRIADNSLCFFSKKGYIESQYSIARAMEKKSEICQLQEGITAGDYVYIYPPGIPFVVPGEYITNEVICDIMKYREAGHEVHGVLAKDNKLYIKAIR